MVARAAFSVMAAAILGASVPLLEHRIPPLVLACAALACPLVVALLIAPGTVAAAFLVLLLLSDTEQSGLLAFTSALFVPLGPLRISAADAMLFGSATVLLIHPRRPLHERLPGSLRPVLAITGCAVVVGAIVGALAHAGGVLGNALMPLYLIAAPLVAYQLLVSERDVDIAVVCLLVIGIIKGALGIVNAVAGLGTSVLGVTLSYRSGGTNLILLVASLAAAGLVVRRSHVLLALATLACTLPSLVLAERRSFWIAAVVTLPFVAILATGRERQQLLAICLPAFVAVTVGILLLGTQQVVEANTVSVRNLGGNAQLHSAQGDAYRVAERRNVLSEIARHPVGGLGLGVPWTATQPMPGYFSGARNYGHLAILWFWLEFGVFGAVAYITIIVAGVRLGLRASRRNVTSGLAQALSAAIVASVVAGAIVELTATFNGINPRYTLVWGLLLGTAAALADGVAPTRAAGRGRSRPLLRRAPGRLG